MANPDMTDMTQPPPQYKLALLNALQGNGGFAPTIAPTGATIESTTEPGKVEHGNPTNIAAGYDVGAWNALSPEQQSKYQAGGGAPSQGTNVDKFLNLLNSGQYGSTQDAINAFNALRLNGDSTGLSSNYGSSPAAYENGNVIGLPDRVLRKNADGTWTTEMRGPSSGGGGVSPLGMVPGLFAGSGINPMLQSNATDNIKNALQNIGAMANGNGYLQSLIAALNGGGK